MEVVLVVGVVFVDFDWVVRELVEFGVFFEVDVVLIE